MDLQQHQVEIRRNLEYWHNKPLLQELYAGFYERILTQVNPGLAGLIVEIGSGIGNLKSHLPQAIATDLFPNPWLDLVCDGYELPFRNATLSHLVLFDVFHHLEAPNAFLKEARRAMIPGGRLILFEPFISLASHPVYGLLHHEPVGLGRPIDLAESLPRPRKYYAAQGNASRLFFRKQIPGWPQDWQVLHAEAFSAFSYLFSGGYRKPACYPRSCLSRLQKIDQWLSSWPRLFGARCLVTLSWDRF